MKSIITAWWIIILLLLDTFGDLETHIDLWMIMELLAGIVLNWFMS